MTNQQIQFADTFRLTVDEGKTYLLRMVNAAMNIILFFSIAKHDLTVVGADGSYTKPLTRHYITISPGQTLDVLLQANKKPDLYHMAARAYATGVNVSFDNTTTTAIVQYSVRNYTSFTSPHLPYLPYYNDTTAAFQFFGSVHSLANKDHPINVPLEINHRMVSTVSVNARPCERRNGTCAGPNGTRLAASMNNISFVTPSIDILEAYYQHIQGVFGYNFPDFPPYVFNFTAEYMPLILEIPRAGTELKLLEYNSTVEMVFQDTNLVAGLDHPMHLHGYSFFVVGFGFGNFDEEKDPLNYNLIDPPLLNTVAVPINGWTTIRFRASNPGKDLHIYISLNITIYTIFIKIISMILHIRTDLIIVVTYSI